MIRKVWVFQSNDHNQTNLTVWWTSMYKKKICRHMKSFASCAPGKWGKWEELTVLIVLSLMYVMNAYMRDLWNP